jgi:hypothetical protein
LTGGSQVTAQSLVGTWECDTRWGSLFAIRSVQQYRADGSFHTLSNMRIEDPNGRTDASVAFDGSWQLIGAQLEEKISSAHLRSVAVEGEGEGEDISDTAYGRYLAESLPKDLSGPSNQNTSQVSFVTADRLNISNGSFAGTCKKQQ